MNKTLGLALAVALGLAVLTLVAILPIALLVQVIRVRRHNRRLVEAWQVEVVEARRRGLPPPPPPTLQVMY